MAKPVNKLRWRLRQVGIELLDPATYLLKCIGCGEVWSPDLTGDGRPRRGYRQCPSHGCNEDLLRSKGRAGR